MCLMIFLEFSLLSVTTLLAILSNVTGFTKADQIVTRTKIQIINDTLMHCPETSTTWL